jgi:hypothetical protein
VDLNAPTLDRLLGQFEHADLPVPKAFLNTVIPNITFRAMEVTKFSLAYCVEVWSLRLVREIDGDMWSNSDRASLVRCSDALVPEVSNLMEFYFHNTPSYADGQESGCLYVVDQDHALLA